MIWRRLVRAILERSVLGSTTGERPSPRSQKVLTTATARDHCRCDGDITRRLMEQRRGAPQAQCHPALHAVPSAVPPSPHRPPRRRHAAHLSSPPSTVTSPRCDPPHVLHHRRGAPLARGCGVVTTTYASPLTRVSPCLAPVRSRSSPWADAADEPPRCPNAGAFYSYLANGLAQTGVAGAAVALLSYNALQIGIYGCPRPPSATSRTRPQGSICPGSYGLMGRCSPSASPVFCASTSMLSVLAVFLTLEIAVVTIYIIGALMHPAGGVCERDRLLPLGALRARLWCGPRSGSHRLHRFRIGARSTAKSVGTHGSRWRVRPSFWWHLIGSSGRSRGGHDRGRWVLPISSGPSPHRRVRDWCSAVWPNIGVPSWPTQRMYCS